MKGIIIMHSSKKVLLTGATGLIGKEAIPFLKQKGFEIYALSTRHIPSEDGVRFLQGNMLDQNFIKQITADIKPTHLLHFAWATTGLFNHNINFSFLSSSMDLLQSFAQYGGKRAVMAGTYAEYGYNEEILKETFPAAPFNVYGYCKNWLRQQAELFCKNNGISFAWGHIFSAYGKEKIQTRLTPDVVNHLNASQPVIIRSGNLIRDYIYSKDVANAFTALLDGTVEGRVNICSGKGTLIRDYVLALARVMGKENLVIFQDPQSAQQSKVIGDNTRLKTEVGFRPTYSLEDAFREILI